MDAGRGGPPPRHVTLDEWQLHKIDAGALEHVEDQQNRRAIRRRLPAASRGHPQPSLKSATVRAPFLVGYDNLAVEQCRSRQALAGWVSSGNQSVRSLP
jgi:hypothetical protein